MRSLQSYILAMVVILLGASVACGGAASDTRASNQSSIDSNPKRSAAVENSAADKSQQGTSKAPGLPRPPVASTPAAAPNVKGSGDVVQLSQGFEKDGARPTVPPEQAVILVQKRIIVRTVNTALVVGEIPKALEDIGALAVQLGGWVVATKYDQKGSASISIQIGRAHV